MRIRSLRMALTTFSITILLIAAFGCSVTYPYLELDVEPTYNGQYVSFSYRFLSEKAQQDCRVYVEGDIDSEQEAFLISPEEIAFKLYDSVKLPNEGVIVFQVRSSGTYVLYFSVLSSKGRGDAVLHFLSDYAVFEVQP